MKSKLFFLPLAAIVVAAVGCGGSGNGIVGIHNPRIRAVNDFSDVSAVSASVGTTDLLTSQAFGTTSAYAIVDNGNRTVTFNDVSGSTSIPLVSDTRLLETEKYYTAIGTGSGSGGRHIILLEDAQTTLNNQTRARVVNADEDQSAVDVYFTSTSTADLTGQTPQMNDVDFSQTNVTYTNFTPGTYKMWVTGGSDQTPIATQTVTLDANTNVTFVVAKTSGTVSIQTLQDQPLPAGTP